MATAEYVWGGLPATDASTSAVSKPFATVPGQIASFFPAIIFTDAFRQAFNTSPPLDAPTRDSTTLVHVLLKGVAFSHRLVFQNLLMETDATVLSSSQDTWTALLDAAGLPAFTTAASPQLAGMLFELACTPTGHVLPPNRLLRFPMPASSEGLLPNGSESGAEKHVLGGEEGADVAKMRLAAGQALGRLACKFAASGMAA